MRILHYSLGFPPYRTGGMTKFCIDLMQEQLKEGHTVALAWPGRMNIFSKKIKVIRKKSSRIEGKTLNIESYEIVNPLPVSYDEGVKQIDYFVFDGELAPFNNLIQSFRPDVIHVHTLMGLHKAFLQAATNNNVKIIYTAHDFYPICPKVTMYRNGGVCESIANCLYCKECNSTALSMGEIKLLQSPLYRRMKDSFFVKSIRKNHRDKYFQVEQDNEQFQRADENSMYLDLREHYYSMLKMMDMVHFNSSVTKKNFESIYQLEKNKVISITHKDVTDNRKRRKFNDHIRFTYLGPQSGAKGYFILKDALDELWKENKNFELNIYFEPIAQSPYMIPHNRYRYSELGEVMNNTDMLIVPSVWYETFGYTVIEALSYGIPVMLSSNVGAKDVLSTGCGVIVEDIDKEKLFQSLKEITPTRLENMNNMICNNQKIIMIKDMTEEIISELYGE